MKRMADRKLIAVTGATGAQGGGMVRAICADPNGAFQARAVTRNPNSDKARALAALGAEVVAADVGDAESIRQAFEGAYGAYCVTFFWEHFSPEKEMAQAGAMAQAARAAGVKHVIWSTLEDTRKLVPLSDDRMPTLLGKYKVPHFDAKGGSDHLFTDAGVPTTFLLTSFYWDNFIYFGMGPKKGADGRLRHHASHGRQETAGHRRGGHRTVRLRHFQAAGIDRTKGGHRGRASDRSANGGGVYTGARRGGRLQRVPPEVYRGFGFPGAEDLGNMFQYKRDFESEFCGARSIERSRELNPRLQTFAQWLDEHKALIPLE